MDIVAAICVASHPRANAMLLEFCTARTRVDRLNAFRRVADCLPPEAPLIIEAVTDENQIQPELHRVCEAIPEGVAAA